MSRSRKKTPITGHTKAESDKQDKRLANRRLRRSVKVAVEHDADVIPEMREKSNVWGFSKDGKQRFDPEKYPKDMRK